MAGQAGTSDFISRVRQRHHVPAAKPPVRRSFIVQITRDGATIEDLVFDTAPTIGAIAARCGTEAYVIATEVIQHRDADRLAAE